MEETASVPSQFTYLAQLYHMKVPGSHSLVMDHVRSRVSEDKQRFRGLWTGHSGAPACWLHSLPPHAGADKTSGDKILSIQRTKKNIPLIFKGLGGKYTKDTATWSILYRFLFGFRNLMCCGEKNILEVSIATWNMDTCLFHQVKDFVLGLCSSYVWS